MSKIGPVFTYMHVQIKRKQAAKALSCMCLYMFNLSAITMAKCYLLINVLKYHFSVKKKRRKSYLIFVFQHLHFTQKVISTLNEM